MWMGLGFYNIPNRFEDYEFEFAVEVDPSVKVAFDADNAQMWDGARLVPLVVPVEG